MWGKGVSTTNKHPKNPPSEEKAVASRKVSFSPFVGEI